MDIFVDDSKSDRTFCFTGFNPENFEQLQHQIKSFSDHGLDEPIFQGSFSVGDIAFDIHLMDLRDEGSKNPDIGMYIDVYNFVRPEDLDNKKPLPFDILWDNLSEKTETCVTFDFGKNCQDVLSMSYADFQQSLIDKVNDLCSKMDILKKYADRNSHFWEKQLRSLRDYNMYESDIHYDFPQEEEFQAAVDAYLKGDRLPSLSELVYSSYVCDVRGFGNKSLKCPYSLDEIAEMPYEYFKQLSEIEISSQLVQNIEKYNLDTEKLLKQAKFRESLLETIQNLQQKGASMQIIRDVFEECMTEVQKNTKNLVVSR